MKKILIQVVDRYQEKVPTFGVVEVEDNDMEKMSREACQKWDPLFPFEEQKQCMDVKSTVDCFCFFGEEEDYIFTVVG